MKQLLVALICVSILYARIYAGEKFLTFSGNITYLNDESRSMVIKNNKNKELSFFVAGQIMQGNKKINLVDLTKGCMVTVTYQKSRSRYIASQVTTLGCQHTER